MAVNKEIKTIGVLTSGGDAPGMNAAIRAVVRRGLGRGLRVFGIYRGYDGLMDDDVKEMTAQDVSDTIQKGGTILYTARSFFLFSMTFAMSPMVSMENDGRVFSSFWSLPGTIDLDISCTEYTIGFDTSVNTAMEAIDKVRDTSTSHERCSIIEVMGRNAGYLALWCGIANGAEDILLPEKYDYDEQKIIDNIIDSRRRGKMHHIIINAEGVGHSASMARRIEAATGIETRATILGHMQRGGSPTAKDRVYASIMGCMAVDLLIEGKSERVVGYKDGHFQDFDIDEALEMVKGIDEYQYEIATAMSGGYRKDEKKILKDESL